MHPFQSHPPLFLLPSLPLPLRSHVNVIRHDGEKPSTYVGQSIVLPVGVVAFYGFFPQLATNNRSAVCQPASWHHDATTYPRPLDNNPKLNTHYTCSSLYVESERREKKIAQVGDENAQRLDKHK